MKLLRLSLLCAFLAHCFIIASFKTGDYIAFILFMASSVFGAIFAVNKQDSQLFYINLGFIWLSLIEIYKVL
jgi:hypothetical protein